MRLVLYTTEYCQLCEEAESLIYAQLAGIDYELALVDISASDELMARYALRIPVLAAAQESSAELGWPFDAAHLLEFTKKVGLV